jgi:hypothetical protein
MLTIIEWRHLTEYPSMKTLVTLTRRITTQVNALHLRQKNTPDKRTYLQ